ncbi:MAG: hypothetical protein UR25_C0002G0050 [Candidatus Nomurabacteria bacterium GW2011_GWE1_32_28]|uniref:Cell division protein FtsL n=1 Tax=Candidatus Nomurabacteria bacterium GW2011_GWF1_31_48 TaxID=1618767 RepID=A0A0F9YFM5_9BACT|nr:MAG: hypothetical protein UR10_C0002G0050 [Candidatus Nomurabacteria bacterium GW2011_GWF2_30_133]KKP29061.1 MAG: hypothetical protein UR18_C0001G0182 [Candidatus Nomurabacteria bacterium GW2011_GWE2_31_40]KKP30529.1 MAG: hypothetical protein UR19_C0002G0050 [Candidatus Nomurabacteria bacterium GW2011_GWF1_31_48]KKP35014.1 MAG: hypothetical protein UR25_C0002G0050 [Candidatus Nomurabacteria bacterium GW2011_GWE1_32_28]HAS80618.1 hypothetical protein [Candidatus Nomurabacteria bacterium]
MKTASLKLKSYANNVNIIDNGNLNRKILNIMLWIIAFLTFSYVFFLGNVVFDIVERKSLETYARTLSNDVGDLELEYLSMSQKVDLNLAYSLGFKEIKNKEYATRKALGSISIAKNEI